MAKKVSVAFSAMTRKQKFLNFLKIFGLSFAGVAALIAGVVIYVWATGGFNPPYVPLTEWAFSSAEYVIDGNKEISIDENGNQEFDENGNLIWKQLQDKDENPIYEAVLIVPNEGCTELDAVLTIDYSTNSNSPIVQLVEDDNVKAVEKDEENEDKLYYKYNVKINSPIYIKPLTKKVELNGEQVETNIGGWVKLTATQNLRTTSCWVFVDCPVLDFNIELNQDIDFDEDTNTYNVYPTSELSVKNIIVPVGADVLPSKNVPTQKGSTAFTDTKKVYYQTSNPEIATIDQNGVIKVSADKQGETFSVTAYIISKYNSIKDYYEDPSKDPLLPYIKDFDRTRVWSNTITFKINPITVKALKTGANKIISTPYEVFENGIFSYSNNISSTTKNNFFVDLEFSEKVGSELKYAMMKNIKLFVGYEGDVVSEQVTDGFVINGRRIIPASDENDPSKHYVTLTQLTDNSFEYTINQYSQDKFYFIFYYETLAENGTVTDVLYDYVQFNITKTDLTNLQLLKSQGGEILSTINMTYNQDDQDKPYDLTSIFVEMTPTKPTYTFMLYFVPENSNIVQTNSSIKIDIAGQNYVAIAASTDDGYDYSKIVATGTGKTTIYGVVLLTCEKYSGTKFGDFFLDPNKLLINDGYVKIERRSESINLTITSTVTFNEIAVDEASSENLERVEYQVAEDDEAYSFAQDCDVYVEAYVGAEIALGIEYIGTTDALDNNRLLVELLTGAAQSVTSITNIDNTTNGSYKFSILANSVGKVKYQVTHDGNMQYTIGINILSTELVAMTLSAEKDVLGVTFDSQTASSFTWDELTLHLDFYSQKTDTKDFELRAYSIPDGFDVSVLQEYFGKDYAEEIAGLPEEINSIEKFVNSLSLTDDIIKIFNLTTTEGDANIKIGERTYRYKFNGIGKVLIVAQSTSTAICSNPILIETKYPDISIVLENGDEITNVMQQADILTFGELSSVDGVSLKQEIQLLGNGQKQIYFFADIDGVEYNINNLINFKFENQDDNFVSLISGAQITNMGTPLMTLAAISRNIAENIVAYTDFGYLNTNFFKYNLIPDYKVVNTTPSTVYGTPTYVDLFAGTETSLPMVVFTNKDYQIGGDYTIDASKLGNKLYIPEEYYGDINDIKLIYPEEFLNTFLYPDFSGEDAYYHIYKTIMIADDGAYGADYEVYGTEILLQYSTSSVKVISLKTNGGYISKISINVKSGVSDNFNYNQKNKHIESVDNLKENDISSLSLFDWIDFECEDGFDAKLYNIDFAVTQTTNDNLTFYYEDKNNKRFETFIEVSPENISYITEVAFNALDEAEKADYKEYFIQTNDISALSEGKTYYLKTTEGFKRVDSPTAANLNDYYEKVYSQKTYYFANTHFEEIASDELSMRYIAKYYEALYVRATGNELQTNIEYYKLDPNGVYVLVTSPVQEDLAEYYVQTGEYQITNDEELLTGKKYYYKKNYIAVNTGEDISNVFEKVAIKMTIGKDATGMIETINLSFDIDVLSKIIDPININFALSTYIQNTNNDAETYFDGYYFNLSFEQ